MPQRTSYLHTSQAMHLNTNYSRIKWLKSTAFVGLCGMDRPGLPPTARSRPSGTDSNHEIALHV